jgi:putative transcriptional regulator
MEWLKFPLAISETVDYDWINDSCRIGGLGDLMNQEIAKGKFLIAMPILSDPNFLQTIVLLCEHGPDGSLGLVVNRPTGVEVSTLIEDFPDLAGAGRVHSGGPVDQNGMLILCRGKTELQNQGILKDVFLVTDLAALKKHEGLGPSERVRCYLGYAGWAPGQLEAEIQAGAWRLAAGDSRLIFNTNPAAVWQEMMHRMGREWAIYASMPPDPSSN